MRLVDFFFYVTQNGEDKPEENIYTPHISANRWVAMCKHFRTNRGYYDKIFNNPNFHFQPLSSPIWNET